MSGEGLGDPMVRGQHARTVEAFLERPDVYVSIYEFHCLS